MSKYQDNEKFSQQSTLHKYTHTQGESTHEYPSLFYCGVQVGGVLLETGKEKMLGTQKKISLLCKNCFLYFCTWSWQRQWVNLSDATITTPVKRMLPRCSIVTHGVRKKLTRPWESVCVPRQHLTTKKKTKIIITILIK